MPEIAGRDARPSLEEIGEMPVIREAQQLGYLLDRHARGAQQVLGDLQPPGEIIAVGGHIVLLLEQMGGPGDGEMDVGGNLFHGQLARQALLDEILHEQPAGSGQELSVMDLGKAYDMVVEQKSQFIDAMDRLFFYCLQDLQQIFALRVASPDVAVIVQLIIIHQVGNQVSLPVEPYLAPGRPGVGIIVVVSTGAQDVGIPGIQPDSPAVYLHITAAVQDVFEDIVVSIEPADMIMGILIGDSRGQRDKCGRGRSGIGTEFFFRDG